MGNQQSGKRCQCLSPNRHRSHPQELQNHSHLNQVTSWIPPRENWYPQNGLPYGWEEALDKNDKPYFINHIERYTTRADPREELDYVEPPRPRDVTLSRDPQRGFGFVAGSEKPVVVRFVTEGGPSMDKLLPGDQIIKINGEDVKKSPRDYVIDLVRSSEHTITLTVCQPYVENAGRKSAFLTPAKKARLRNNPTRVRFADAVIVNGTSVISPSCQESYVPLMPNVLKVFLENGQTKSFKYDNKTTVKDVLNSLQEKLSIQSIQHFALVLYNMRSPIPGKLAILREDETIAEIAAKPGSRHFRCLFRVTFVPVDAYALLKEDPASFEYYFTQCCNDVVQERFAGDLKYESMFRLSALQIHQHVTSRGTQTKFSLKTFEKEFGLNRFVPRTILENMKLKDVRRTLTHYLRQNQNLTVPGQKHLSTIQARLHYIKILSDLLTFGGRIFLATIAEGDNKAEHMIVVGPRTGISRITNVKTYALEPIADFEHIENMSVTRDGENLQWVSVDLKGETTTTLCVGLLNDDVPDFLSLLEGYYRVLVDCNKVLLDKSQLQKPEGEISAPVYDGKHRVIPSHWSYPDNIVTQPVEMDTEQVVGKVLDNEQIIDLSQSTPEFEAGEVSSNFAVKLRYVNGHETQYQAEDASRDAVVEVSSSDELCSKTDKTNSREAKAKKRETNDSDGDDYKDDDDDDDDTEEKEDNAEGDEEDDEDEDDVSDPFTPDEFVYSKLLCESNDHDFDTSITPFTQRKSESSTRLQQQLSPSLVCAELLTFKRYVPSPISMHAKRLRQRKLGTSTVMVGACEEELLQVTAEKSSTTQVIQSNLKSPPEDSALSDTDSTDLNGLDIEEKPLLSARDSLLVAQSRQHSNLQKDSDSDSWGTPTGSPNGSPGKRQRGLRPHSFNFTQDSGSNSQKLTEANSDLLMRGHSSSFGLHSPDQLPNEMLQAVCNSECESSLCFDQDIIDLTLIPPPEVVEEEARRGLCGSVTSAPPPSGFSDDEVENSAHRSQCKNRLHRHHHHHHHHQQKLIQPVSLGPDEASIKLLSSPSSDVFNVTAEIHSPSSPFCVDNRTDSQRAKCNRFAKVVEREDDDISGSGDSGHKSENHSCSLDIPQTRRSKARAKRCQQMVRSASAEHCPSILDEDIDTLIAKLIVPPPPRMDEEISCHIQTSPQLMTQSWSGWSGDSSYSDTSQGGRDSGNLSLEEDISSLVIPPPPVSSSSSSESFNNTEKSSQPKQGAMSSVSSASSPPPLPPPPPRPPPIRNRFTRSPSYQRANSIDLLYERDFEETMLRRSDSQESLDSQIMLPTTEDPARPMGQYRVNIQSPTSVSEKLKNLLQLMPTTDEAKQSMVGKRSQTLPESECPTSNGHSLIIRSSSESVSFQNIFRKDDLAGSSRTECNQHSQQTCDNKALRVIHLQKFANHEHISCTCDKKICCSSSQSNSEGCDQYKYRTQNGQQSSTPCSSSSAEANVNQRRRVPCQNVSHCAESSSKCNGDSSVNVNIAANLTDELPSKYLGKSSSLDVPHQPSEETNCTQVCSSSETFSALKTKLQAYRDFLLNRKTKTNTNSGGGDLRRSNSFTVGTKVTDSMWKAVFSNGGSNKRKVSAEAAKVDTPPAAVVEKNSNVSSNIHKQTLMLQGISTIPRAILRRRVNKNQPRCLGAARTGPMKALQNIFGNSSAGVESEDKTKVKCEDISEADMEKAAPSDYYEINSKKLKDNPYSTVRLWRPVALGNQSTDDSSRVTRYVTFKRLWDSFKVQKTGNEEEGDSQCGNRKDFPIDDDDEDDNYPKVKIEMLGRIYNNENGFTIATEDIELLVVDINMDMQNLQNIQLIADRKHFECVQSKLYQQIQQFVYHAKFFLINAALTKEKLVLSLMTCMHSLTRVFLYGRDTMIALNSVHKAHNLGTELIRLANAFKSTMHAANTAAGKPNTDPHVQYLMRQALSLASLLRSLLALVKSLEFQ